MKSLSFAFIDKALLFHGGIPNFSAATKNRPGTNGIIVTEMITKAPPDGHALLFPMSAHTITPIIQLKLPFDTLNDFAATVHISSDGCFLSVVKNDFPAKSVMELVALGKSIPLPPGTFFRTFGN